MNGNKSVAASLGAAEMDRLRSIDFADISYGPSTLPRTVDGVDFSIQRDVQWVSKGALGGAATRPVGHLLRTTQSS